MGAHRESGDLPGGPGPAGAGGDTIAAVSTGAGRAAVAVIRLSGPASSSAIEALAGRLPAPRRARLAALRHPRDGAPLDQGLVLWFPGPASATGEDMAEFQVHGGRAVVAAVLGAVLAVPGVRAAEAGEFTRRAFLNGRMDLAEVEGLADLIGADTDAQRRLALAHAFGHLSGRTEAWRSRLLRAMALIEAGIDFPDEDDIPAEVRSRARPELEGLSRDLAEALADRRGRVLREGASIAIAGRPNAGKSSLLNALAARDVAIVSDEPGTTRDVLELPLDLGGLRVVLVDTAGLRDASGRVEQEGIRRARQRIAQAELVLWVHDGSGGEPPARRPDAGDAEGAVDASPKGEIWLVENKADLFPVKAVAADTAPRGEAPAPWARQRFAVSATTGEGLDALIDSLAQWSMAQAGPAEHPTLVRERHRAAAGQALHHVEAALSGWETAPDEVLAEELRSAAAALGRITGRIGTEDLLDVVFREFCIGK